MGIQKNTKVLLSSESRHQVRVEQGAAIRQGRGVVASVSPAGRGGGCPRSDELDEASGHAEHEGKKDPTSNALPLSGRGVWLRLGTADRTRGGSHVAGRL